jgi:phytoene dehydrogenase-like protein
MPERRQVVIVGASYGGLIAGALLAKAGMDTLLVDEFDLVGQPGGAVPYDGYWIDWCHRDTRGTRDCMMVNFRSGYGAIAAERAGAEVRSGEPTQLKAHLLPGGQIAIASTDSPEAAAPYLSTVLALPESKVVKFFEIRKKLKETPTEEANRLRDVRFAEWLPTLGDDEMAAAYRGLATSMYSLPPEATSLGRFIENYAKPSLRVSVADDDEVGGMQGYMEPFARAIRAAGGEVRLEHKLLEMTVADGTARGVLVRDERGFVTEIEADFVIYAGIAYDLENYLSKELIDHSWWEKAYSTKKHELPTTALYLGLKEIPRKRDGRLEDWTGWNRLLVGENRTYNGGWFIPSLASRRSAPEGKQLLEAVYGGPASYGNGKKALETLLNYIKAYYPGIESLIEWQQVQYHTAPSTTGWSFSGSERVPVEGPLGGLFMVSSTSEVQGSYQEIEANAALQAADAILEQTSTISEPIGSPEVSRM